MRTHADNDVVVHIPYESFFNNGYEVALVLDADAVPVQPINPNDLPPVIVRRLAGPLAEGRHTVTYQVRDDDFNPYDGFPEQPLRIDRTAPGGVSLASPEFSPQVIDHGVTPDDLVDGLLGATVPAWTDMEDGDWVEPYYQLGPGAGVSFDIDGARAQVGSGEAGRAITLRIAQDHLLAMGEGERWFGYVLRDLAGNASAVRPTPVRLTISLLGDPADRLPGGAGGLPEGEFAERNASNGLNKALVQSGGGTPFRVGLDYLNVALNDRITLRLQGHDNLQGTGAETPNTAHSDVYVVQEEDLPTEEEPVKFHDFLIPTSYFAGKWHSQVQGRGSVVGSHTIANAEGAAQAPSVMVIVAVSDL